MCHQQNKQQHSTKNDESGKYRIKDIDVIQDTTETGKI